jgi:tetratricopeptide (TPR) repeat protein
MHFGCIANGLLPVSIINNVLKDLESRPSRFTPIEIAVAEPGRVERNTTRALLLTLLPVFIVLVAAAFYYQTIYEADRNQVIAADKTSLDKNTLPITESTPVVKPVQNRISGLQIRETSSEVSLEFSLRERAVSYLKERSENLFIFHLKSVHSEIEAPKINDNRWIENLQIQPSQQGIDVILKTVPGVLVNTAQTNKRDENLWTISLEKLPDPAVLAKLETVVVEPVIKPEVVAATVTRPEAVKAVEHEKAPVKVEIKTVDQSQSASVKLTKAAELIRDRQWQEAEPLLQSLLDSPLDFSARRQLLVLYARSGNINSYLEFARQTQNRYPRQSIFTTELARALFQHQQYLKTIDLLQNAGDLDAAQYALLAASYQRTNRHQEAVEHYLQALQLDRGQARNWIGLGISLEHEAKLEKALQSYNTALRLGNLNERLIEFVEQRSRVITKVIN